MTGDQNPNGDRQSVPKDVAEEHARTRKALEAAQSQIMRAERLQLAGTVAAQIAHDFRNLLSPLLLLPDIIKSDLPKTSPSYGLVDMIASTARDMLRMIEDLSALSNRGQGKQSVLNVNDIAIEVVTLLQQKKLPSNTRIVPLLSPNMLNIKAASQQIRRVVENLCGNALDAMGEDGGVLTVKTEIVYLDTPFGRCDRINVGEYVKLTVTDTGKGIPKEIEDKIFDPFFTTKDTAERRGSGLGLSIVYGIVKDHDGYVDFESTVGAGSSFFVYFPICRDEMEKESVPVLVGGKEKILVVDDDFRQVKLLKLLLTTLGYDVQGVLGGAEALEYARHNKVDLFVIDAIMPRVGGVETCRSLHEADPGRRFVMISGLNKPEGLSELQETGVCCFVRKPLTLEEIGKAVRGELDRRKA